MLIVRLLLEIKVIYQCKFDRWFITSAFRFICFFPFVLAFILLCMLNLQIVSFWEELWKDNTKTFRTNVFKGQTDNAFVFLCKGLWQPLCFSLFSLWILSAFTFFFIALLVVASLWVHFLSALSVVLGGFYLKWLKRNSLQYCFVFFVSPQRQISQREISYLF